MRKKVQELIKSNISFLFIGLGAISNFLLILLIQNYAPEIFTSLSIYLTFIGIITSFGLLGFDQVYLRLAKLDAEIPKIQWNVILTLVSFSFIIPFGFSLYFMRYEHFSFISLYLSAVGINTIMLGFNANRLSKKFTIAQILKNAHKIIFLILSLLLLLIGTQKFSISKIFFITSLILIGIGGLSLISFFKNTLIDKSSNSKLIMLGLSFAINIALITAMGYGERILIINKISEEVFGTYFYFLTVFLFPLSLLQEYVGFKELVYFKDKLNKNIVYKKTLQLFSLGTLTYLLILLVVWIDNSRFLNVDLESDKYLIFTIYVLGITKLIYALFSAILGARASSKAITYVNLGTTLSIALLLLGLYFLGYQIAYILLALILVFLYRSLHIYYLYVR